MLTGPEKALLAVLILVLMTGMGATLDGQRVRDVLQRPRGILVGLLSQFGWMPLIAFGLAIALRLPNELALPLVLIGCTPGGTTSNLFAYFSKADVALSIGMTSASSIVAVVAMPAVLWLYGSRFTEAEMALPLADIAVTLALVLVPVALGMLIRSRSVRAATLVEKVGSGAGVAVLVLLIVSGVLHNRAIFGQIPPAGYVAAVALGILGMSLGYGAARLAGLDLPQRRAVSLETGIQNSPLAIAIVVATFPEDQHDTLLWMPLLYALFVLLSASAVTLLFRRTGD